MPKTKRITRPNPFITSDHAPTDGVDAGSERVPAGTSVPLTVPGLTAPAPSSSSGSERGGMAMLRAATGRTSGGKGGGKRGGKRGRGRHDDRGSSVGRRFNSRHRG